MNVGLSFDSVHRIISRSKASLFIVASDFRVGNRVLREGRLVTAETLPSILGWVAEGLKLRRYGYRWH